MIDYFRRTYIVDRPYSSQLGFEASRPETNVKGLTSVKKFESPVSYKPYGSDSYHEMMHFFPGYEGIRRYWFDSEVGGQGTDIQRDLTFYSHPFDQLMGKTGAPAGTWADCRDAAEGGAGESIKLYYSYVSAGRTAPLGSLFFVRRFFLGFDLTKVVDRNIKGATFKITFTFPDLGTRTSISLQPSNHNPPADYNKQSGGLGLYSNFYGSSFTRIAAIAGTQTVKLPRTAIGFLKQRIGSWAAFCLREYSYDYLNVEPGSSTNYTGYFFTGNYPVPEKRPTLILHY